MKRTLKQRVGAVLVFVFLGVACGSLAGYLLGRTIALHAAQTQLDAFANHIATEEALASAEARSVLAALHSSSAPLCSETEIVDRSLQIYQSKFLKDAGRIRDGKIICSSIFGRFQHPIPLPATGVSHPDGTVVYWNLAPFLVDKRPIPALQQGDAYVVLGSRAQERADSDSMYHYFITTISHDGAPLAWKAGTWSPADHAFTVDGQQSRNGNLYVTHCLPRYAYCLTASLPISAALHAQRVQLATGSIFGGLLGACFGFMASFLYRRNRSTEQQLRRAIRRDNLHLLYQPIVNLTTGRVIGAEALIRWTDEEGFACSPEVFIRLAEERGFVYSITRLVVRHVLRDFGPLLRQNPNFRLSINVVAPEKAIFRQAARSSPSR
jgi:sensor c-di-GMP phosphodiesterase-like protein